MYVDAQLLFSDAQAITAAAGSTNVVDLGNDRYIGTGRPLYVVVQVDTAFTDTGSNSTLTVTLESDDDSAFGSATTGVQTIGTLAAVSAAGSRLVCPIAPNIITERYIRLYYTPNNGDLSAGAVTAFITMDPHLYTSYADGITIS